MKTVLFVLGILWCLVAAYLPIATTRINHRLLAEIGCKPVGDCYLPGTSASLELDILAIVMALVIWPVCAWFLGGRFLVRRLRNTQVSSR
jgi:hypothetical protein